MMRTWLLLLCGLTQQCHVAVLPCQTFRMNAEIFYKKPCCDLLICDEAHRLKNSETATTKTLAQLDCRRRILLSGTPLQNDLEEFFSMVNLVCTSLLHLSSADLGCARSITLHQTFPGELHQPRCLGESVRIPTPLCEPHPYWSRTWSVGQRNAKGSRCSKRAFSHR